VGAALRPVVLAGFMAAGKTSVGRLLAARLGRPFVDLDDEIEALAGEPVQAIFAGRGEEAFRRLESEALARVLARNDGPVLATGGGALLTDEAQRRARDRAFVVVLDVSPGVCWERVRGDATVRPLARDRLGLHALHAERAPRYVAVADALLAADGAAPEALAGAIALAVWTRRGLAGELDAQLAGRRSILVADPAVAGRVAGSFGARIELAGGEDTKTPAALERLWRSLAAAEAERSTVLVCAGGGTVTDVGGYAAASFRRGLRWLSLPTTLVGQVDAGIGGKTGINVAAKNDVGAFWQPEAVLCDPDLLETLRAREWAGGLAEVVKTALLAGGPLWDLVRAWEPGPGEPAARTELVQRCAGVKALVVASDPTEQGLRAVLNLGHTIGHGVEAVAGYGGLNHGESIAVGLVAALWLSERLCGLDPDVTSEVEQMLRRHALPVQAPGIDPDAVLAAMRHDKKRVAGELRFVLLEAVGSPVYGVAVPAALVAEAVGRATSERASA
jgi:shikimate kinase/3-dehydroquinate synthase